MKDNSKHSHQLTERVKLLQKVALVVDGQVLILKRGPEAKSRPEKWDLPGGNSEWPSESEVGFGQLRWDAAREVAEETDLEISPESLRTQDVMFLDTFFDFETQIFTMIVGWQVLLPSKSEKITISHEHTEFKWVSLNELENYDFGVAGDFVKKIIQTALTTK